MKAPLRAILLVGALLVPSALAAQTDSYPSKPIRIVVAFTAGGTTDIIARLVGKKMTDAWGQPVVIENRPGAGGNLGSNIVAKAPPDGYTLLIGSVGPLAVNATLYPNMPYDNLKDFAPICLVAEVPNMLVVHPSVPVHSVQDLVNLARAKPGTLNYGSTGNGTTGHLSGELLNEQAKIDLVHIPYRGATAVTDLLGGQIQLMFATIPSVIQHVRAGSLRAIAVTSRRRSPALPEIPTVAESGYPGFEASSWYGFVAPAGTPDPIIRKLHGLIAGIVNIPEINEQLSSQGADPVGNTPEEFAQYMRRETDKWAKVVKASGIRID
jgi:tripartite-type tricarboxylate transporter receptor subunit TctC